MLRAEYLRILKVACVCKAKLVDSSSWIVVLSVEVWDENRGTGDEIGGIYPE